MSQKYRRPLPQAGGSGGSAKTPGVYREKSGYTGGMGVGSRQIHTVYRLTVQGPVWAILNTAGNGVRRLLLPRPRCTVYTSTVCAVDHEHDMV